MEAATAFARKYGLIFYWAAFAGFAAYAATKPGYMPTSLRALYPYAYPWRGLFMMWGLLAVFVWILYWIIQKNPRPWRRICVAFLYSLTLLVVCFLSLATDLPGLAYVPLLFSLVTFIGVCASLIALAIQCLARRKNAP